MECQHNFIGHSAGVTCEKCGLNLTPEEYRKLLQDAPKEETPAGKPAPRKRKKSEE